jgi:hypothetical protein
MYEAVGYVVFTSLICVSLSVSNWKYECSVNLIVSVQKNSSEICNKDIVEDDSFLGFSAM